MNDWEIFEENTNDEGESYKRLTYKHSEGEKHYNAYYYSPEEIYVEVWSRRNGVHTFMDGGMSWSQALEYDINEDE